MFERVHGLDFGLATLAMVSIAFSKRIHVRCNVGARKVASGCDSWNAAHVFPLEGPRSNDEVQGSAEQCHGWFRI